MKTNVDFEEVIKEIDDIIQKLTSIYAEKDYTGSRKQRIAKDTCVILQLAREVLLTDRMQQ